MAHKAEKRRYHESNAKGSGNKRQLLYCDYCKMQGNSIDKCWKVHGYPSKFKKNTWKKEEEYASKANTSINEVEDQGNKRIETKLTRIIL